MYGQTKFKIFNYFFSSFAEKSLYLFYMEIFTLPNHIAVYRETCVNVRRHQKVYLFLFLEYKMPSSAHSVRLGSADMPEIGKTKPL